MQRKNFVVIMAAGSGSRMGASRPKQFLDLGGRMILQRTIEIFMEACPDITVVTVLPPDFIDFWRGHWPSTPADSVSGEPAQDPNARPAVKVMK